MTEAEKQELKQEILEELMVKKSNKSIPGLEAIKKKWFNGSNPENKYRDSVMEKRFGSYGQHKVWDAMRTLARLIFHKTYQSELQRVEQEKLEHVCNALCELVCSLEEEVNRKESKQS